MPKISLFPEGYVSKKTGKLSPATNPDTILEFEDYIEKIRDGYWQDYVIPIRAGKMEKLKAPGVTASGIFTYRNIKGMVEHSGIIPIDIDAKDNPDGIPADMLGADDYTHAIHRSISGKGLVLYVKIDPEKHLEAFLGLQKYYRNNYHIEIDPAPKNPASYRFVSFDPDATLIKGSKIFRKYLPKPKSKPRTHYVHAPDDIEFIFGQIKDRGINLCEDYNDWISVGMSLANHFGEAGRDHFHFISSFSAKYSQADTDKHFTGFLKRGRKENTIATFFHYCQEAGLKIKTPKTDNIERIARMRRKSSGGNGGLEDPKAGALKTLEMAGISREEAEPIIDQVMSMPEHEVNKEKTDDLISDLKAFLTGYKMEFNEITRMIEVNGDNIDDRILNSIYIRAKEVVSKDVTKDLLFSLIDSDFTQGYNPFQRFFNSNRNLKPDGLIGELLDCIEYKAELHEAHVGNYLEVYMQKWLLSIIASMHRTHSEMILVLIGGQGEKKTKFFRNLLPDDLLPYYAESKLDKGDDDHMMMCKKIIVMDDEFGGKNKQEAKKIKDLSSKDTFTIRKPYGRFHEDLKRIAVLCGTSNEDEVINDPTGNRRIIPVNVISIDFDKFLEIDKTALWMELYWKWKEIGDGWFLTKDEIKYLNQITLVNEQPSIEEESIQKFFEIPEREWETEYMTTTEICNHIETNSKIKVNPYKMGMNLKKLGFVQISRRTGGNSHPRRVYPVKLANCSKEVTTPNRADF